jgi:hypothetical protein
MAPPKHPGFRRRWRTWIGKEAREDGALPLACADISNINIFFVSLRTPCRFAMRELEYGENLDNDHPGFSDKVRLLYEILTCCCVLTERPLFLVGVPCTTQGDCANRQDIPRVREEGGERVENESVSECVYA